MTTPTETIDHKELDVLPLDLRKMVFQYYCTGLDLLKAVMRMSWKDAGAIKEASACQIEYEDMCGTESNCATLFEVSDLPPLREMLDLPIGCRREVVRTLLRRSACFIVIPVHVYWQAFPRPPHYRQEDYERKGLHIALHPSSANVGKHMTVFVNRTRISRREIWYKAYAKRKNFDDFAGEWNHLRAHAATMVELRNRRPIE